MIKDDNRLYDLIDPDSPAETLAEIKNILLMIDPSLDPSSIEKIFEDIIRIFKGEFPGYKASNTKYHNLGHTCSTALATARLIHGLHVQGQVFSQRLVQLCIIGSLFHDTGLIQTREELEGTGAQHTVGHEDRSIALMGKYLAENGYSQEDIRDCGHMIKCTELFFPMGDILKRSGPWARLLEPPTWLPRWQTGITRKNCRCFSWSSRRPRCKGLRPPWSFSKKPRNSIARWHVKG
jgi:hypothetical protein